MNEQARKRGDQLAYPFEPPVGEIFGGLTIREHFAGLALLGLLSNPEIPTGGDLKSWHQSAVAHADGLLEALEKPR